MSSLTCPECQYENVVVSCGFCLQCGIDLDVAPCETSSTDSDSHSSLPSAIDHSPAAALAGAVAAELDGTAVDAKNSWAVRLPTGDRRFQVVHFVTNNRRVSLLSICGPAIEPNALTLLTWNSQLQDASFAARKINGQLVFVAKSTHQPSISDLPAAIAAVKSLAKLADSVESKISSGADRY